MTRRTPGRRVDHHNQRRHHQGLLIYLHKGETYNELASGFGVSVATAWRYVEETVALLRARAPKLDRALRNAARDGLHYLVLDGTLIPIDRVRADRPYYSAKHRMHGMNIQVIASPDGTIIWTPGSLPGSTHDLTAARIWAVLRALAQAGMLTLADKGYQGAEGPMATPYKGHDKPLSQKAANRSHARLCRPWERANARLKGWRILRKLRCCPHKAGQHARRSPSCRTTSSPTDERPQGGRIPIRPWPVRWMRKSALRW